MLSNILSFKINIGDEASIDANKKEKYKTLLKLIYMLPRSRRSAPHIKKLRQKLIILKNQYLNNYEKKIELLIKIGNESLPVSNLENVLYFDKEIELRFEKNQFHYEFKSNNDIVNLLKGLLLLEKLYSSYKELKRHLRGSCAAHMWLYKKICNSFPELVTSDLIEWINLNKSKVSWLEVE